MGEATVHCPIEPQFPLISISLVCRGCYQEEFLYRKWDQAVEGAAQRGGGVTLPGSVQ